jgi:hypothetical protein
MDFKKQFRAARRVSTPLIAIRTADPNSAVQQVVASLNGDAETTPIVGWDIARALRGISQPGAAVVRQALNGADALEVSRRPSDFLMIAETIEAKDLIAFMFNAHKFLEDPATLQGIWNLRDTFKQRGQMLVMTMPQGVVLPAELKNDVLVIDEALPTREELRAILDNIIKVTPNCPIVLDDVKTAAVDAVAGLAAFPAEQAMAESTTSKGIDLVGLWERKRQAIEQTPGLSVHRGEVPKPVGLANILAFLMRVIKGRKRYGAVLFVDEIEKAFAGTGTDMSGVKTGMTGTWCTWITDHKADGVLFIGVPGGGKTLVAKWLGWFARIVTIIFDFGGMQAGIIGETEQRLRDGLNITDAVADGKVLIVGTCNAIGQMPPEVLSRFNLGTFFFDLMSEEERGACWSFYRKQFEIPEADVLPEDNGWTGREIMNCCSMASQLTIPLVEAADFVVPVCRASAASIKALRQQASGKYVSASASGTYQWEEKAEATGPKLRQMRSEGLKVVDGRGGNA